MHAVFFYLKSFILVQIQNTARDRFSCSEMEEIEGERSRESEKEKKFRVNAPSTSIKSSEWAKFLVKWKNVQILSLINVGGKSKDNRSSNWFVSWWAMINSFPSYFRISLVWLQFWWCQFSNRRKCRHPKRRLMLSQYARYSKPRDHWNRNNVWNSNSEAYKCRISNTYRNF